jgi:NAD(P)-dependent dehydrogenase (short-subunit alcohol dehydrogenase family)
MDELVGRTAVVTGAASGMGLAFAERWSNQFWIFTDDVFQSRMAERHSGILAGGDRPQLGGLWEVLFAGR